MLKLAVLVYARSDLAADEAQRHGAR